MSASRTLAIGDIHGCDTALHTLLDAIAPTPRDTLIFLGDYVDRGPNSQGVLERILQLDGHCQLITLLGNHDAMFLSYILSQADKDFWLHCGGEATMASYGHDLEKIPPTHVSMLDRSLRYYETDSEFFLHANYIADLALAHQPERTVLWEHLTHVVPPPHRSGKRAIVGHTAQTSGEVLDLGHVVCIDTYCYGGGWLTALDVTSDQIWQANELGQTRTTQLKDSSTASSSDGSPSQGAVPRQ